MREGYCRMKQWSGPHKTQHLAHLQGIVMLCQGAAPRSDHSSPVSKITSYLPTPSTQIKQLWSGHILVRFRVVTSGKFTSHVLLLAHAQSPCSHSFLFPLDNNAERLSAGNGHTSPNGTTGRDPQKLPAMGNFPSEASSDNPAERRRTGKFLSTKQKEKEKGPGKSQEGKYKLLVTRLLPLVLGRASGLPLTKAVLHNVKQNKGLRALPLRSQPAADTAD